MDVDAAETDILSCLFVTLEDNSPTLSEVLEGLRSRGNWISIKQRSDLEDTLHPYARVTWQGNPPNNGTGVHIEFDRDALRAKAEEWGVSYNEVFAQVMIHEVLHPGMGQEGQHSGNDLGGTLDNNIYGEPIGQAEKKIYEDLFDDKPPGWKVTFGWPTDMNAPGCLGTIRNDPAHEHFYNGLTETHNALLAYPTFDVFWLGQIP